MALTRANAEAELVQRAKKKMLIVKMLVTTDGTNDDLNSPLAFASRAMGLTLASPVTVTSAELASLTDAQVDQFLDRAELRLLENILGNFTLSDIKLGPHWEEKGAIGEQLQKQIDAKRKAIASAYGDDLTELEAGSMLLNFAQKHDDEVA
jgi:hypothetical protein